ncbi:MAG: hypothetical protein K2M08_00020 [Anaeroplasmataceae bacterium]|nr:hypothetical protein [Anaeroplasmataceae bacterium]
MKYIAFLDFLGTKQLACSDRNLYTKTIQNIKKSFVSIVTEDKDISFIIMSDSIYLESKNRTLLLNMLNAFRNDLAQQKVFFTCAVTKGKLGLDPREETSISKENSRIIALMDQPDTVEVYSMQVKLQGIAIDISTLSSKKYQVKSVYLSEQRCIPIYDLRYAPANKKGSRKVFFEQNLRLYFHAFAKQAIINERASRYYITPIKSILYSMTNDEFEKSQNEIFNSLNIPILVDNFYYYCIFATIIERYFDMFNQDSIDNEISEFVKEKYKENNFSKFIANLQKIPDGIISYKHKTWLVEIITELQDEETSESSIN